MTKGLWLVVGICGGVFLVVVVASTAAYCAWRRRRQEARVSLKVFSNSTSLFQPYNYK